MIPHTTYKEAREMIAKIGKSRAKLEAQDRIAISSIAIKMENASLLSVYDGDKLREIITNHGV